MQPLAKIFRRSLALTTLAVASLLSAPLAHAQSLADWGENNFIDMVFRAQTWTIASNIDVALDTSACSDSAAGTEASGGSYARPAIARSLANWAGTQSSGSTSASSGTGGVTSNNVAINFATPSAGWGTVTHFRLMSSTNMLVCQALTTSKTINSGDTVSFPIGSITFTIGSLTLPVNGPLAVPGWPDRATALA